MACAPTVQVHSVGVMQHERAADQEAQAATSHAEQYRPVLIKAACSTGLTDRPDGLVCWTSTSNPTDKHRREAEKHRSLAAAHRAASSELRKVEESTCTGISPVDRDLSPFAHPDDILRVESTFDSGGSKSPPRQTGVGVTFRAVPGLTSEWLQRLIDCHIARSSVIGHDAPELAYCPLAVRGVTALVRSDGGGFAVILSTQEQERNGLHEIRQRVNAVLRSTQTTSPNP